MSKIALSKRAILFAVCMMLAAVPALPVGGNEYISDSVWESEGFITAASASRLTMAQVNSKTYTLSQRGNMYTESARTRMASEIMSLDATGYSIKPGESITVNVNAGSTNNLPKIFLQSYQSSNHWYSWVYERQLTADTNTITLPFTHHGPAAIFFYNGFLPNQQPQAPVVTITSGGVRHPLYIHGETNPAAFKNEVDSHSGNDIAVAVSDNAVITTSNTGMKSGLALTHGRGHSIYNVMEAYEKVFWEFNTTLSGFDMNAPIGTGDSPRGGKIVMTTVSGLSAIGYAGDGLTVYDASRLNTFGGAGFSVNYPDGVNAYVMPHEVGHSWEMLDVMLTNGKNTDGSANWGAREVLNIVFQEYAQYILGRTNTTFDGYDSSMANYHANRPNPISSNSNNEQRMMAISVYQIMLAYDYAAFGRAYQDIRLNTSRYTRINAHTQATAAQKWENMILSLSNAVGRDLTPHFAYYHLNVSDAAKTKAGVNLLPEDERKTYYARPSKNREPGASAFVNPSAIQITRDGNNINLTGAKANELLVYEIIRGTNVVGVAYPANGATNAAFTGLQSTDTIIAYDRTFQPHTGGDNQNNAQVPNISAQPTDKTVDIGETAQLSVTANVSRGTLSYQWFEASTKTNSGGTAISGATGATFNAPTTNSGAKHYYCVVTNTDNAATDNKTISLSSIAATVTVRPRTPAQAPNITTQPTNKWIGVGETAVLTVEANVSRGTLSYQWYEVSSQTNSGGNAISGATGATYNVTTNTIGKRYYYCAVTNTDNQAPGEKMTTLNSNAVLVATGIEQPVQFPIQRARVNTWSTLSDDAYKLNSLFDNNPATYWHGNYSVGSGSTTMGEGLVDIDLGSKKSIETIEIDKRLLSGRGMIGEVRMWIHTEMGNIFPNGETMSSYTNANVLAMQILNDFRTDGWALVTPTISGLSKMSTLNQTVTLTFSTPVEARYIRLGITAYTNETTKDYVQISEVRIHGTSNGATVRYGDVNGDGIINATDITLLRRYLIENNKEAFIAANSGFNIRNADVNGDGVIDQADVALLRRYVAATDPSTVLLGS